MKKMLTILIGAVVIANLAGCDLSDDASDESNPATEWTKDSDTTGGESGTDENSNSGNDADSDSQEKSGSQADSESEDENSNILRTNKVGESSIFVVGEDENEVEVTLSNWGVIWNDLYEQKLIFFDVEFNNIGENSVDVSPGLFTVYADDYAVEIIYAPDDSMQPTTLSSGRKAKGRVYALLDPDSANSIEVQVAKTVWVLKNDSETNSADSASVTENVNGSEDPASSGTSSDYEDFSGTYADSKFTAVIEEYPELVTASDGTVSYGKMDLYHDGEKLYSRELYLEDGNTAPWNKDYDIVCSFSGSDVEKNYVGFLQADGKKCIELGFGGEYSDTLEIQ